MKKAVFILSSYLGDYWTVSVVFHQLGRHTSWPTASEWGLRSRPQTLNNCYLLVYINLPSYKSRLSHGRKTYQQRINDGWRRPRHVWWLTVHHPPQWVGQCLTQCFDKLFRFCVWAVDVLFNTYWSSKNVDIEWSTSCIPLNNRIRKC